MPQRKRYHVQIKTVGQCFGSQASVVIDGQVYRSRVCPYGFEQAAINDLLQKLNRQAVQEGSW
jgi:hypothetical protein